MATRRPPRGAAGAASTSPPARTPRGAASKPAWAAILPRDSAEMRSPSKTHTAAAALSSPPFGQPTSPADAGGGHKRAAPPAPADPVPGAARAIQRWWRGRHAALRARRLHASRAQLLAKQAQLEAARGGQRRTDRVGDILGQLRQAREAASAAVQQHQQAARDADSRRQSDTSRQQAARKIQMQWLRCKTARRARASVASSGTAAAGLMSYLEQTSSPASGAAAPAPPEAPPAAELQRTSSLTDLLTAAGSEQYRSRYARGGIIVKPAQAQALSRPSAGQTAPRAARAQPPPVRAPVANAAASPPLTPGGSVAAGVRTHVSTLKTALAARDAEVSELQQQLEAAATERDVAQRDADALLERKLEELRAEYDPTIKRQLEFVDTLLKDKEELAEKYTAVATELEESDASWNEKLKKQAAADKAQLKRHKDAWAAAEKVRRDKWMEEQMAQVKAQTIKGLEPEIQRMMTQHKTDLETAEQNHRVALRRARDDMLEENNQNLRRVRQELLSERTEALQHDRDLAATRIREHAEQSEAALRHELTTHAKLKSEWEAERSRMEREGLEDRRELEAAKAREAALLRSESALREQLEAIQRSHQQELKELQAQARTESDGLRRQQAMDEGETIARARDELRAELTKERDAQIEEILSRLAEETEARRVSLHKEFKERVDGMVADHKAELLREQREGRQWMDKYNSLFEQQARQGAELQALRVEQQHSERESAQAAEQAKAGVAAAKAKTQAEADKRAADAASFASEAAAQSEALQRATGELQEAEQATAQTARAHEQELQRLQQDHETVLRELNERVRDVMTQKDGTIEELRMQLAEVEEVMLS